MTHNTPPAQQAQRGAAYDYDRQRWVSGAEAAPLRKAQLQDELAVLESARGSEYHAFMGMTESLPAAVARCRAMIAAL